MRVAVGADDHADARPRRLRPRAGSRRGSRSSRRRGAALGLGRGGQQRRARKQQEKRPSRRIVTSAAGPRVLVPKAEREEIGEAGAKHDRRSRGRAGVIGEDEASVSAGRADQRGEQQRRREIASQQPCGGGGKHHEPDRHQRAERLKARDEIEHDEAQEEEGNELAPAARAAKEDGIERVEDERAVEDRKQRERHARDAGQKIERRIVERERRAEEHMQQIDARALDRDERDAERERDEIEGRERGVLAQRRKSARRRPTAARRRAPRRGRPRVIAGSERPATR